MLRRQYLNSHCKQYQMSCSRRLSALLARVEAGIRGMRPLPLCSTAHPEYGSITSLFLCTSFALLLLHASPSAGFNAPRYQTARMNYMWTGNNPNQRSFSSGRMDNRGQLYGRNGPTGYFDRPRSQPPANGDLFHDRSNSRFRQTSMTDARGGQPIMQPRTRSSFQQDQFSNTDRSARLGGLSDVASAAANNGGTRGVNARPRGSDGSAKPNTDACNNCGNNVVIRTPELSSAGDTKDRQNTNPSQAPIPALPISVNPINTLNVTSAVIAPTRTPGPLGANERFVSNRMAGRADPSPSDATNQGTSVSFSLNVMRQGIRQINPNRITAPAPAAVASTETSAGLSVSPGTVTQTVPSAQLFALSTTTQPPNNQLINSSDIFNSTSPPSLDSTVLAVNSSTTPAPPPAAAGFVDACQLFFGSWPMPCAAQSRQPAVRSFPGQPVYPFLLQPPLQGPFMYGSQPAFPVYGYNMQPRFPF
ncbi:uncharacterized protein LOC129590461 [Paramacrobiotus metropolitanus]|uniref:uncharacterized protein LOC129590461 n=1 Tax=Paramacrobiotus metropolitanus TaxID=2943436 RepID=UPI00244582D6|nr:uncharacterized protein LOC129590461 [Paramacrobiotus metropolitanus]